MVAGKKDVELAGKSGFDFRCAETVWHETGLDPASRHDIGALQHLYDPGLRDGRNLPADPDPVKNKKTGKIIKGRKENK